MHCLCFSETFLNCAKYGDGSYSGCTVTSLSPVPPHSPNRHSSDISNKEICWKIVLLQEKECF